MLKFTPLRTITAFIGLLLLPLPAHGQGDTTSSDDTVGSTPSGAPQALNKAPPTVGWLGADLRTVFPVGSYNGGVLALARLSLDFSGARVGVLGGAEVFRLGYAACDCDGGGECCTGYNPSLVWLAALLEYHWSSGELLDPYVAVEVGAMHRNMWRAGGYTGLGCDIRGRMFGIGPYLGAVVAAPEDGPDSAVTFAFGLRAQLSIR